MLLGVIPVGATYGVLSLAAGLPVLAAIGMSSIVFAGSSQFVGVQLLGASVASLLVLTVFVGLTPGESATKVSASDLADGEPRKESISSK